LPSPELSDIGATNTSISDRCLCKILKDGHQINRRKAKFNKIAKDTTQNS
jgi:hypothetical protein